MNNQTINTEVRIYVGTYSKYNNGSIGGDWLTLSDYSDAAEFMAACEELHSDETDIELMFQDYECPSYLKSLMSESMTEDNIQAVYDAIEAVNNSHLDEGIISAYISNVGINSDIESTIQDAEEAYSGSYDSDEDFAEDLAEQTGYKMPNTWPYNCIDWTYAAREIMYDYFESNGHYFRNL